MNNIQETLLFPVRDAEARKQFLIACLVALVGFIIPVVPFLALMGYGARIMRQVIEERKSPSMPDWQGSDWSEMLLDGLRLYGSQLVLMLPLFILMGCGLLSMTGGSVAMGLTAAEDSQVFAIPGFFLFAVGALFFMLFAILVLPFSIATSVVGPHVITNRSFSATFQFKEWWNILRRGIGQFILAYVIAFVTSMILMFIMQFAMMTIILMCIVPILMIPYTAYITLLSNTLFAQAYAKGVDALKAD